MQSYPFPGAFALVCLCLPLGCGSEAPPPGADASADVAATDAAVPDAAAPDVAVSPMGGTLRATVDGVVVDFEMPGATIAGLTNMGVSVSGRTMTPSRTFSFGRPNALGTVTCVAAGTSSAQMGMTLAGGAQTRAAPSGECNITLTQVPAAVGEFWVGTFSGRLTGNGGLVVTVTDGSFRLPRR